MIQLTGEAGPVFVRWDHVQAVEDLTHEDLKKLRRLHLLNGSVLVEETAGVVLQLMQVDMLRHARHFNNAPGGAPLIFVFSKDNMQGVQVAFAALALKSAPAPDA